MLYPLFSHTCHEIIRIRRLIQRLKDKSVICFGMINEKVQNIFVVYAAMLATKGKDLIGPTSN